MPAHAIDLRDPQSALRVLLTLVLQNGGELRFKACDYDQLDRGRLLTVDFDRKRSQVVLRATSDFASAVPVAPEAHAWVKPIDAAPTERARVQAEKDASRIAVHTDEELAEREEELARRQAVARLVQEGKSPMRIKTVK